MKKLFLVLICLFMSYEVKSLETMLKCTWEGEDEFILYINSKYNYIGELEDFEEKKEISKKENKMEITDTQIKTITIIPGKPYLNDDLRSVMGPEGEIIMVLNRLDGKFEFIIRENNNNRVSEEKYSGKCKKHEKLF